MKHLNSALTDTPPLEPRSSNPHVDLQPSFDCDSSEAVISKSHMRHKGIGVHGVAEDGVPR